MKKRKKPNSEIGRTTIAEKTKLALWGISAGRCELCNVPLYMDNTFGVIGNFGEMAHIHAVSPGGPRHKNNMTSEEKNDVSNLMLLCSEHHHMIDSDPDSFVEGYLMLKKKQHENRIRAFTETNDAQTCKIVTYFSNIDNQEVFSNVKLLKEAVIDLGLLPEQCDVIELHAESKIRYKADTFSFQQKQEALLEQFNLQFKNIVKEKEAIAIFSLAPQPLLFFLGTLINDQYNAKVFQCHRTGHKWRWLAGGDTVKYNFIRTKKGNPQNVALVLDLSAKVADDRITSVIGDDCTIFHISIDSPNRVFVTSETIQNNFIKVYRQAMEEIKNLRPVPSCIHIFPVVPNSLAIKAGMDYMPKTDLPIILYEQGSIKNGFFDALRIGG